MILRESRFLRYILRLRVNFVNRKAAMNMAGPRRCVVDTVACLLLRCSTHATIRRYNRFVGVASQAKAF